MYNHTHSFIFYQISAKIQDLSIKFIQNKYFQKTKFPNEGTLSIRKNHRPALKILSGDFL